MDAVGTVDIGSSALPLNAATETTLSSIDGKITTTPNGIKADVVGTIDIGSSALPTGAATETTLSSLDSKVTTTPNGIKVDAVGTVDIGSSALPTGASTEATLSNLDSKVTTTANGIKVDSIVSSGQIDSYTHDGSGNAITSTTVSTKQAIDVNVASGTFTVTATNPSVGTNNSPTPTSSTLIGGEDGGNIRPVGVTNSGGVNYMKVDTSGFISPSASTSTNQTNGNQKTQIVNSDGISTTSTTIGAKQALDISVTSDPSLDVFATNITGSRYNQIEINFEFAPGATLITNTTSGGASITQANGHSLYSTGTATSAEAKSVSVDTIKYRPAHEIYGYFTASFTNPTSANSYQRIGIYDTNNGFFVGFNGLNFGITKRTAASDTFVNRSAFNTDLLDGSAGSKFTRNGTPEAINLAYSNVFRIRFGWLGSASILFDVFSPDGIWVTFHAIKQPNSALNPSVTNPDLPMTIDVYKGSADATNLVMTTACWAGGTTSGYSKITDTLTNNTLASITRSVITGVTTGGGGGYVNVKVNPSGALVTDSTISGTVAVSATSLPLPSGASTSALQTTGNSSLSSIDGKLTSVTVGTLPSIPAGANNIGSITNVTGTVSLPTGASTSALQTTANTSLSNISTYTLAISGQLPPTIGEQGKLNSLAVTLAPDSASLQTKSPLNDTASGSGASATVSTVITLTAPANAVGFILMNMDTSTANIRYAIGRTASATLGQQLQPGRDTGFIPCGANISLCAESGTQTYDVQWVSQ